MSLFAPLRSELARPSELLRTPLGALDELELLVDNVPGPTALPDSAAGFVELPDVADVEPDCDPLVADKPVGTGDKGGEPLSILTGGRGTIGEPRRLMVLKGMGVVADVSDSPLER